MQKVIRNVCVLLLCCCSGSLNAQQLNWGVGFGGVSMDVVMGVVADSAGNAYSTGYYLSDPLMDPDTNVFEWSNRGSSDIFIMKQDALGNIVWGKSIGSLNQQRAHAIVADDAGYIYVTGHFQGIVDFDPDSVRAHFLAPASAGSISMFLLKLDTGGNFVWVKEMGVTNAATFGMASGHAMVMDKDGHLLITGEYASAIDFDPGPQQTVLTTGSGLHEVFAAKYDRNGNLIWAVPFHGGTSQSIGYAIQTDGEANVYVAGSFQGTVDFDPGSGVYQLSSVRDIKDAFLCKLATDGSFRWAFSFGDIEDDYISGLVVDDSANVYATGRFQYTVDFDPDPVGRANQTSRGGLDVFLTKYDSSGNFRWVRSFGAAGIDIGQAIAIDVGGNLYLGGGYSGTVDFDPGIGTANLTTQGTSYDFFVAKYDRNGNYIWATGNSGTNDAFVRSLDISYWGNLYAGGVNTGAGTITVGSNSLLLPGNGNLDMFILNFPCDDASAPTTIHVTTCDSFAFNGIMYYGTGAYSHLFRNIYGCDSIVTLDLVIRDLDPIIAVDKYTLSTMQSYASYQWLLNGQGIQGAVNRMYTVTDNGDYQVAVSQSDGCTDTSAVYPVNNVSVMDPDQNLGRISMYPNPTGDMLHVTAEQQVGWIVLRDMLGKQIVKSSVPATLDLKQVSSGIYVLMAYDPHGRLVHTGKVIKK